MAAPRPPKSASGAAPDAEHAMRYALRVLAARMYSTEELRRRLARRGATPDIIAHTLATLARLDLVNDREFARAWIASHPGHGPTRLRHDLGVKGIPRELAEELLRESRSVMDEYAAARQVADRALRIHPGPPDRAMLLRIRRLLQRRGFSYAVIAQLCMELRAPEAADGDWLE